MNPTDALINRMRLSIENKRLMVPATDLALLCDMLEESIMKALEFYGTKQEWDFYCGCCADGTTPLEKDMGRRADQALERIEGMVK